MSRATFFRTYPPIPAKISGVPLE